MLIVIRGNSGSGKSTLAAALQQELDGPTAILGQDHFRRVVYRERLGAGMEHAALMESAASHCLERGHHVIVEGILPAEDYSDMLERIASRADDVRFFAYRLSFDETVARHAGRPQASEFTPAEMREWYHGWDPLPFVDERTIGVEKTLEAAVARVLTPGIRR